MNFKKQKITKILVSLFMILAIAGCTKKREPVFPDGQGEDVIGKEQLAGSRVTLRTTSESVESRDEFSNIVALEEFTRLRTEFIAGPEFLKPLFKDFTMMGEAGKEYLIRFRLTSKFLTAFKEVQHASELSIVEQEIGEEQASSILVPIFQVPVQGFGTVIRSKNDLNEETSALRFKTTDWENASHIQISLLVKDRQVVDLPAAEKTNSDPVFVKSRIDRRIFTREKLNQILGIRVASSEETKFLLRLNGDEIELLEITRLSLDSLTASQKQAVLDQDNSSIKRSDLARCSAEILSQLPDENPKDCVMILRFRVSGTSVNARRIQTDQSSLSSDITFQPASNKVQARLIQVGRKSVVSETNLGDVAMALDPTKTLKLSLVKGKEFLFRRVLTDAPTSFEYTFPGSSADLSIVRFVFEKNQVRVIRSEEATNPRDVSDVDKQETFMLIPAAYFRLSDRDAQGNLLSSPRFIATDHTDPQAIAYVDWTANKIPTSESPLNYYDLETCFVGSDHRGISEVDQKLDQGMLNFTLSSIYSANLNVGCVDYYQLSYFDRIQTNYVFKERISFQLYEAKDEQPLLSIPFSAQKQLGFGLFTSTKKVPDKYGNTGSIGTEIPLVHIFDIRDGKQITYILGGLPSDQETRQVVIDAVSDVIKDWNLAFKRALQGTDLERENDVLVLKIEGEDQPSQMGDLNSNYIYYVQKKNPSGIIGLGGNHSNPRSGRVENGNVFVYGGNIVGYIEYLRKLQAFSDLYNQIINSPNAPVVTGDQPEDPKLKPVNPQPVPSGSVPVEPPMPGRVTPAVAKTLLKAGGQDTLNDGILSLMNGSSQAAVLKKAWNEIIRDRQYQNPRIMEATLGRNLIESMNGHFPRDELLKIKADIKRQDAVGRMLDRMRKSNICLYETNEADVVSEASKSKEYTDAELLSVITKTTLAHELGHNLGLRHNFIGSFDKQNWMFDGEKPDDEIVKKRNYSSIMDYLKDDHLHYVGLAPQDVASIRAAYTGLMEVDGKFIPQVEKLFPPEIAAQIKTSLVSGKFISLELYRKLFGFKSWVEFDPKLAAQLPLKNYQFCTDEDVGYTPVCNRFDEGSTPLEIVQDIIREQQTSYAYSHFPNDRIRFGMENLNRTLGRFVMKMIQMRQFLEEGIYQAITGGGQKAIVNNLVAAMSGADYLMQLIRTPDAPLFTLDSQLGLARFVEVTVQVMDETTKKPVDKKIMVERKWLDHIGGEHDQRMDVMGIELEKALALLLLTERRLGFERYERVSLRISVPEVEGLLYADENGNPLPSEQLPSISLLSEILSNNVTPATLMDGNLVKLGSGMFKTSVSETLRVYAAISSILNLDVDGLEAKSNLSSLFRVMSGFKAPLTQRSVVMPGSEKTGSSTLKLWSADRAAVASSMVSQVAVLARLAEATESTKALFQQWVLLVAQGASDDEIAAQEKILDTKKLNFLPEEVGPRTMKEIGPVILAVIKMVSSAQEAILKNPEIQDNVVDQISNKLERLAKNAPIYSVAIAAIPVKELKLPLLDEVTPSRVNEVQRAVTYSNLEVLNKFFYELRPEYKQ